MFALFKLTLILVCVVASVWLTIKAFQVIMWLFAVVTFGAIARKGKKEGKTFGETFEGTFAGSK